MFMLTPFITRFSTGFFYIRLLTIPLILALTGCSNIPINQDYDPNTDFSQIKRLQWLAQNQQIAPKASDYQKQQPLMAKRIERAIQNALINQGVLLVTQEADAFITYHVTVENALYTEPVTTHFSLGSFGRHGGIMFQTSPDIYQYKQGKLVIDILDLKGDLLWRGISPSLLTEQTTPEITSQKVNAVVEKILSQFPPKPPK